MNNNIEEITERIIPLSALNSLNENGFKFCWQQVNEKLFFNIVEMSDPLISVNLLRCFYLYYRIYISKLLIKPILTEKPEFVNKVLDDGKSLELMVNKIVKKLEKRIIH